MVKRTGEKIIFQTKFFTIKDIDIEFSNGQRRTYQIIEKSDTAMIVPITINNDLILIEEYYYATDSFSLGLPKGRIEPKDDALYTANKELQEEVGYKAGKLDLLGTFTMTPGYSTQKTHIYLARDLTAKKLKGDEEEPIKVIIIPFSDFEKLIEQGKLTEARMIAALYLTKKFLKL